MKNKTETQKEAFVSAIIVAAGASSRMAGINKIFAPLNDVPVIAYTLRAFEVCDFISEIIVVTREEDIFNINDIVKICGFKKVSKIVKGGKDRTSSVLCGIKNASENAEYYAVHDGARPLICEKVIENVIFDAYEYGAATASVPSKDTVKISDENGFVEETPDRSRLYCVQTPQVFEKNLFLKAISDIDFDNFSCTDDCQLLEKNKVQVFLSEGDYGNIKITTPEDIFMAQAILNYRSEKDV